MKKKFNNIKFKELMTYNHVNYKKRFFVLTYLIINIVGFVMGLANKDLNGNIM